MKETPARHGPWKPWTESKVEIPSVLVGVRDCVSRRGLRDRSPGRAPKAESCLVWSLFSLTEKEADAPGPGSVHGGCPSALGTQ